MSPFFPTDRGTKYCGTAKRHEYELYLAPENIDHTRAKTKSPQTNGICERFHRTVLNEFYRVALRRKLYSSIAEIQADLDVWLEQYNEVRTIRGGGATARLRCTPSALSGRTGTARLTDGTAALILTDTSVIIRRLSR